MLRIPKPPQEAKQIYSALLSFAHTPQGKVLIPWLESEKRRMQDQNDKQDDLISLRQTQGANQVIEKFLKLIREAKDKL
jgi:hypothetical protein